MSSIKHRLLEECTLHGSAWQSIRRSTSRCSNAGCSTESFALAFLPHRSISVMVSTVGSGALENLGETSALTLSSSPSHKHRRASLCSALQ